MIFQVRDADGSDEPVLDGVLRLEEARTYHVQTIPSPTAPRAWLGVRELPWSEERAAFTLEVGHWVGSASLRISRGEDSAVVAVEVAPRPEKLSDGAWLSLLAELEAWSPGLAIGFEGGGIGAVQNEGTTAPVLASALLPLVPGLVRVIRTIAAAPRELATSRREDVPLRAVRRADRETLGWLARHPAAASPAVDPWSAAGAGAQDPEVPRDTPYETVDHPVNRYIAWLVGRIVRVLRELAQALGKVSEGRGVQPDTAQWCRARGGAAASAADELSTTLRRTFLGALMPTPATEAALLAVQDDPVYARAHALGRPFLMPRFRLRESLDGAEASVRPSFELYELWTLLAVKRALDAVLEGWTWTWQQTQGNPLLAGFKEGAVFTATRSGGDAIELHYNLKFPGYLARKESSRYSISGERRPDIVISFRSPERGCSWICLDAKYRVRRGALAEAFESLHIYRDSLRWEAFGGSCRGGLLLAPAVEAECQPWFTEAFREQFGIGAWRMTPGDPTDLALAKRILAMAGEPASAWAKEGAGHTRDASSPQSATA